MIQTNISNTRVRAIADVSAGLCTKIQGLIHTKQLACNTILGNGRGVAIIASDSVALHRPIARRQIDRNLMLLRLRMRGELNVWTRDDHQRRSRYFF